LSIKWIGRSVSAKEAFRSLAEKDPTNIFYEKSNARIMSNGLKIHLNNNYIGKIFQPYYGP